MKKITKRIKCSNGASVTYEYEKMDTLEEAEATLGVAECVDIINKQIDQKVREGISQDERLRTGTLR